MKKILSSYFFRLLKSYETLILLAVLFVFSVFSNYLIVKREPVINGPVYVEENGTGRDLTGEELRPYRFESMDISAFDAYRFCVEPIPQESFDKLSQPNNQVREEIIIILDNISGLYVLPCVLMAVFVPLFFGRMFSDGTIKNLLSSGHSKAKIYFSSLIFTFVLDILMMLVHSGIYVLMWLCFQWKPPVYLPLLITLFGVSAFILLSVTSILLAFLFISGKKTVTVIAGFVILALILSSVSMLSVGMIIEDHMVPSDQYKEDWKLVQEVGWNNLEEKYDYLNADFRVFYGDREIAPYSKGTMNPVLKYFLLTTVYADPALISHFSEFTGCPAYLMYRDGLMAVNIANNAIYILLSSCIGLAVFRKREIHC